MTALLADDPAQWRKSGRRLQCFARGCLAHIPAGTWHVRVGDFVFCASCWKYQGAS